MLLFMLVWAKLGQPTGHEKIVIWCHFLPQNSSRMTNTLVGERKSINILNN